jgi:hypothetical protein
LNEANATNGGGIDIHYFGCWCAEASVASAVVTGLAQAIWTVLKEA